MNDLAEVLNNIAKEYDGEIRTRGKHYVQVDMAAAYSMYDMEREEFEDLSIFVPIRKWRGLLKISRHPGSDFRSYRQLDSGVIISKALSLESDLPNKAYQPPKEMIFCGNQREFSRWYIHHHGLPEEPSPEE